MCLGKRINVAVAVGSDHLSAIRADDVAVVLDKTKHLDVHQARHIHRLLNDHRNQLLRAADNDDSVKRKALENGKRNVSGSGRHIDEHIVHLVPDHVRPELLYRTRDNGAAPDHGLCLIIHEQVKAHNLYTRLGLRGEHTEVAALNAPGLKTECLGNRGTRNIRVEYGSLITAPLHGNRQHRGDEGLSNASLSADNANNLFYVARLVLWLDKISLRALLRTSRAIMSTF